MESPNPKYILSLVPLCGRAPDVLQIVQVFYIERDLFKAQVLANSSDFLLVGRNTKKIIFCFQDHTRKHTECTDTVYCLC